MLVSGIRGPLTVIWLLGLPGCRTLVSLRWQRSPGSGLPTELRRKLQSPQGCSYRNNPVHGAASRRPPEQEGRAGRAKPGPAPCQGCPSGVVPGWREGLEDLLAPAGGCPAQGCLWQQCSEPRSSSSWNWLLGGACSAGQHGTSHSLAWELAQAESDRAHHWKPPTCCSAASGGRSGIGKLPNSSCGCKVRWHVLRPYALRL